MAEASNIYPVDSFVGRAVMSRTSANKIGQLHDLIIRPVEGILAGIAVNIGDSGLHLVEASEIYSIGPDAIMLNNDRSAIAPENSPVKELPFALNKLIGVEVITEGGKVLGQVANIFMRLAEEPVLIYEVRSSILDKLLGRTLFFPASYARAFSAGEARLVVDNSAEHASGTLQNLADKMFEPAAKDDQPVVVIRSYGN